MTAKRVMNKDDFERLREMTPAERRISNKEEAAARKELDKQHESMLKYIDTIQSNLLKSFANLQAPEREMKRQTALLSAEWSTALYLNAVNQFEVKVVEQVGQGELELFLVLHDAMKAKHVAPPQWFLECSYKSVSYWLAPKKRGRQTDLKTMLQTYLLFKRFKQEYGKLITDQSIRDAMAAKLHCQESTVKKRINSATKYLPAVEITEYEQTSLGALFDILSPNDLRALRNTLAVHPSRKR